MSDSFTDMILRSAQSDDLAGRMETFYENLDRTIETQHPRCQNRGICCQFGRYGHRLYVTSVELAYFVRGHHREWRCPTDADEKACPYQVHGRCEARKHRPMGCRIFYCDPASQHWQNAEYERQMRNLKGISASFGVEYRYQEWLSVLGDLKLDSSGTCRIKGDFTDSSTQAIDRTPLPVIQ